MVACGAMLLASLLPFLLYYSIYSLRTIATYFLDSSVLLLIVKVYDPNRSGACTATYYTGIGVFALITIPLAMLDLTQQAILQIFLTWFYICVFNC